MQGLPLEVPLRAARGVAAALVVCAACGGSGGTTRATPAPRASASPARSAPAAPSIAAPSIAAPSIAAPSIAAPAASATPSAAPAVAVVAPLDLPRVVAVPRDRRVLVAHAPEGDARVIAYMHGVCGDAEAFRVWEGAAARFGTVISVVGEVPCGGGRFKWGHDPALTDRRIRAAIEAVGAARGGPLDAEAVTLVGYSQGAARAARIAGRFPDRYRTVILVADPTAPDPRDLRNASAVALIGGALDLRRHLRESADELSKAGLRAAYFELPGARHGAYGPEGERVLGEALAWALAADDGRGAANVR